MQLTGIHHVTAVTARAKQNFDFYTKVLGMRLVKKTVNQDDVSAYHLFYADGLGTPGTDLTFFDWPVGRERRGSNSVSRTGMRVQSEAALEYWQARFSELGAAHEPMREIDGRPTILFEDPEGQRLSLTVDLGIHEGGSWEQSPVPPEHQIRGLGPVTLAVREPEATARVLTELMGMRLARSYCSAEGEEVRVFEMGAGGPGAELHVVVDARPPAGSGAGGVHHVAFRTPDIEQYHAWAERLAERRVAFSGPIDRYYFRSLYFREPNRILFEIATDGPGFAGDEPLERLGERLSLPPFLEHRRAEIEAGLQPL